MNYYAITETNWQSFEMKSWALQNVATRHSEKRANTQIGYTTELCAGYSTSASAPCSIIAIRVFCRLRKSGTSAITSARMWKVCYFQRRITLKTDRYDGNCKRFEHGDGRDAAGRLGIERCGETDHGSGTDTQATLCWRTFPHEQGSVRTAVYQSPYLAGLPGWDRRIIPYTQFAGKILYKASDLEKMLEANYARKRFKNIVSFR